MHFLSWSFKLAVNGSFYGCVIFNPRHWSGYQIFKFRPVVYEKHWSGSQIRISIRITSNFELGLPMIITSLLTRFHQNPTSSFWEILLTNKQINKQTNKQTDKQTNTRRWLQYPFIRGIITSENVYQIPTKECKTRSIICKLHLNFLRSSRHFNCDTNFAVIVFFLNESVIGSVPEG